MLLILPPDAAPKLVESVCAKATARGWQTRVSHGEEQLVVALAGSGDGHGLTQDLGDLPDVEIIPILSGRDYWRQRLIRRVIGWLALGLGLLTALGIVMPMVGFLVPPKHSLHNADHLRSLLVSELPQNAARVLRFRNKPVLVVHHGNQHYFALSAICTHMEECQLEWDAEREQIVCPCHGCVFDLHGNVVRGPASIPLARFGLDQSGDRLVVSGESR